MEKQDSVTSKSWKKGQGKRSKKRIGVRKKTHTQVKKMLEAPASVFPAQWINDITIPGDWTALPHDTELRLCHISRQNVPNVSPLVISRSVVITPDSKWMLHINGHSFNKQKIAVFSKVPDHLDADSTTSLIQAVSTYNTCIGNPEKKFTDLAITKKNTQFLSHTKEVVAYLDTGYCLLVDGQHYSSTVRTVSCHLLTDLVRCIECDMYRKVLVAMCYRFEKSKTSKSKKINYRYMKTPERLTTLRAARQTIRMRNQKIARMKQKLEAMTSEKGIEVDSDVMDEIEEVIEERTHEMEKLPKSDFKSVFWNQQVTAMKLKGRKGMRWHPLFIRWCLNLSRISPKAYEVMKESGIELPTRRTLNDYTHWVSAKSGFSHEVDMFLRTEAKVDELKDWQRFVVLIMDEMKIHENLVYDRTGQRLHGFIDLGDVNSELMALECEVSDDKTPCDRIATHVLTLMVRGIFFKLEFPYANFPTQGASGHSLFWIMWEAVRRLEEINLKVAVFVCDGAKPNRKFLKSIGTKKNGIAYKTVNRYCSERYIYFMSDVPHLMKTTRNCWFSSSIGGTRCMWKDNKHILWDHLKTLYEKTQAESGLYIGRRLRYEHVHLTSFSKMKVNLAAQVLSSSVSAAFKFLDDSEYDETAKFCAMFDRFFDCLNTRNVHEGKKKRKPELDPYTSVTDERFKWLEEDFLGYLESWDKVVSKRQGFSTDEKKRMTLSQETLEGLRMTVYSFVEVAKFLLAQREGLFLLSERFNQDPLESFFGQQRARGGRSDNPDIRNFLYNTQAIRVQRSMAIGHGGNVRKRKNQWTTDLDDLSRPLKKRRRTLQYQ